ncbi:MAG: tetratricopeptide repeat protein [Treponema sp.]|nr:tetratricopeptide repeat protein [Treponema sp.]
MNVMDYYHQGVKLIQQGDYDAAIEVFDTALSEYPDSFTVLGIRASTYLQKEETEKALADYIRMIALNPRNPDGWNSRGCLYLDLGEYDKAIADFTQCIPLSPPGYGTYWSNRGIAYYEKGDLDAALADLTTSIECWADPECSNWALFHRGLVWEKKGELDKALEDFTLASTYEPSDHDAFYHAGYIHFMREDYEQAIGCFSQAIAARDDIADNWLARGVCYWNKRIKDNTGFWDEDGAIINRAVDDFTRAIECSPDMAEAYFNRGAAHRSKAQESVNLIKAIIMQKAADDAGRSLLLVQLGRMGGKDLIPHIDALLRGLRFNHDEAGALIAQCAGLFAEDDAREAIEDLSRAIALEPDNAEAYYQRGLAYTLMGAKDKAFADYEQACALDPNHGKAVEKRDELLEK